nr:hypothetical protein [uncultured Cupriavidus sp.]
MSLRSALLIAAIGFTWTLPASAAGCQYDMQCKGDRICQQGQCTAPDADDAPEAASAPKPLPTVKLTPQPPPASVPRSCCTVAGKLKLGPQQSGDAALAVGDACQGITNTGKPVPGTACN